MPQYVIITFSISTVFPIKRESLVIFYARVNTLMDVFENNALLLNS